MAIATPAATRAGLVREALVAGKDVFVEKPLALTVKEGARLVALARDRVLMVGHILQYHPAVPKLKDVLSSGRIGRIQYLYSNRLNIGRLRTEESILWSFAPHDISVILMLLGEEPVEVDAFGGDYLSRGVYDTTLTTLGFAKGVKAHIFVSWLHPYKEQKLVIVGSEGMVVFDDVGKDKLLLYPHRIEWKDGRVPVAEKADFEVIPVSSEEPLEEELKHFADSVRDRTTPSTDGTEGLRVLAVLERAEAALERKSRAAVNPPASNRTYFVHETAVIDDGVEIGEDTRIWHFTHILNRSKIGRDCVIGQNVMIGPDAAVGDGCKIQNNVSLFKGVHLEDKVFCGPSCVFTNVYNPRAFIERKGEFLPTLVKKGATIGANATIICGVTIGRYAMVGAGSVVKTDVPDYGIVAGTPARQKGWACKCGVTLKEGPRKGKLQCSACRTSYKLTRGNLYPLQGSE